MLSLILGPVFYNNTLDRSGEVAKFRFSVATIEPAVLYIKRPVGPTIRPQVPNARAMAATMAMKAMKATKAMKAKEMTSVQQELQDSDS